MIKITHSPGLIKIEGHAGYAPIGQDIVCAAVSTLLHTFLWSIDGLTDDVINDFTAPGKAVIEYENLSDKGQVLMDSFLLGIEVIAHKYPENVKLTRP